jgi:acyl-CoA synthetase (AMP-forming)/AMP-acid ligase II
VTSIASRELLADTRRFSEQGYGVCVGRPLAGIELRTIAISDGPVERWSASLQVPEGEIGEIVVRGPLVSPGYYEDSEADRRTKVADDGGQWHRMGDLGWLDKKGRLWFCGRKSQRVVTAHGTLYTVPCEAIFNCHPAVLRSALVGVGPAGRQQPVICVELHPGQRGADPAMLVAELASLAQQHELTRGISLFLIHPGFPVDIRHNAKIFRERLALWAAKRLDRTPRRPGAAEQEGRLHER